MQKNGFTIIEVCAVFLLILGVTFFVLPLSLDNTKQANYISRWKDIYADAEYMFSVINAQNKEELEAKIANNNDDDNKKTKIIFDMIRPYMRTTTLVDEKTYEPRYMNKNKIYPDDRYYLKTFYHTDTSKIVGLKWFGDKCDEETICGLAIFDVNGTAPPNQWGKDIFGINILKGKIEPIGKNVSANMLKNDCSDFGHGIYCSYYYLIGGQFD